jgi:hypothetical protein
MNDQKKKSDHVSGEKILVNTLYVVTILLIFGFFLQSITDAIGLQ